MYNFYAFTLCVCTYKYTQIFQVNIICKIHIKRITTDISNLRIKNIYKVNTKTSGISELKINLRGTPNSLDLGMHS